MGTGRALAKGRRALTACNIRGGCGGGNISVVPRTQGPNAAAHQWDDGASCLCHHVQRCTRFGTCTGKQRGSLGLSVRRRADRAETSFQANISGLSKQPCAWTRPTNPASLPRGPSTLDQIAQQICGYRHLCERGAASSDLLDRTADADRFGMGREPVLGRLLAGLAV